MRVQSSRRPGRPAALRVALLSAFVAASLGARAPVASADTFRWIGNVPPLPTSWANGLNWFPIGGPTGLVFSDVIEFSDTFSTSVNDRRSAFLLNGLRAFVGAPAGATGTVGGLSLMFSGSSPFIEVGSAGNLRVDNALTGSATVTKSGSGVLVLGGNNAGYSGTLSIADGQVTVVGANSLGTLTRVDVGGSGRLRISTAQTFGGLAGTGIVELAAATTVGIDPIGSSFEGQLSGSGALTKGGVSTLRLAGAGTGYTGAVTVASGTLALAGAGAVSAAAGVAIDAPGTLRIDTDQSLRRITGNGALVLDAVLTVGQAGNSTFDGSIDGAGGLTKVGAGTVSLSGDLSAFRGQLTVSEGVLALVSGVATSAGGASSFVIESAGTLRVAATKRRLHELSGRGMLVLDQNVVVGSDRSPSRFDGSITGVGDLTKEGTGAFTFGGTSTGTGDVFVREGRFVVSGGSLEGGASLALTGGHVRVSGPGSRWSVSTEVLVRGQGGSSAGTPDLVIENGGALLVTQGHANIGFFSGALSGGPANVLVHGRASGENGARATFAIQTELRLGRESRGGIVVADGGLLMSGSAVLGTKEGVAAGGFGTVEIDGFAGPATWENAGMLIVGDRGGGTVAVSRGGSLSTGSMKIGNLTHEVLGGPTTSTERSRGEVSVSSVATDTVPRSTVSVLGQMDVGVDGDGTVNILQGGTLSSFGAALGTEANGFGIVRVTSAAPDHAAVWNNTAALRVGNAGAGELFVEQNGRATTGTAFIGGAGGTGMVRVSRNGASWIVDGELAVGGTGTGTGLLAIQEGGYVKSGTGRLGVDDGAAASVLLARRDSVGGPATWEIDGDLIVGTVNGAPANRAFLLSILSDSQALVTGAARVRKGGFIFLDGGLLQADSLELASAGAFEWRSGTVRVKSVTLGASPWTPLGMVLTAGQVLEADVLDVGAGVLAVVGGQAHVGALRMAGGTVAGTTWTPPTTLSGYGTIAARYMSSAADARIHASGGSLVVGDLNSEDAFQFGGEISVGAGSRLVVNSGSRATLGSLTVLEAGSSLVSVNGLSLGSGSELRATGSASIVGAFTNQGTVNGPATPGAVLVFNDDVDGAGSFTGNVRFEQIHSPGNSPAIVTLENVTYASTSTLDIEILGPEPGTGHDRIEVSGLAALAGTLDVAFLDGYAPTVGTSFILMTFGSHTGQFGTMAVSGLAPSVRLVADYGAHDLTLTVAAVPEPHEWALMMAGLGVVGWTVRRKRVG